MLRHVAPAFAALMLAIVPLHAQQVDEEDLELMRELQELFNRTVSRSGLEDRP